MASTQTSRTKQGTLNTVDVDVWEERDRISIVVTNPANGETIAEWWDDDARSMIDDGFFKPGRGLHQSVADYCQEHGLLDRAVAKVKHRGSGKRSAFDKRAAEKNKNRQVTARTCEFTPNVGSRECGKNAAFVLHGVLGKPSVCAEHERYLQEHANPFYGPIDARQIR